jgi:peptidoglycan/xylan/chitin deacetylase (PgdA/CDA1 family)
MIPLKKVLFYFVKPLIFRSIQLFLRRRVVQHKRKLFTSVWPINEQAGNASADWKGWPEKKEFAFILQHDVDTQRGHDQCRKLMDLEEKHEVRSTFYIVPERYLVSYQLIKEIKQRGFGVGVHGLKHDGKLFLTYDSFQTQAKKINDYLRRWGTSGFSAPSMIRRLDWMHHLEIDYSTSTFDTDPFEPQPEPANTIFPYYVGDGVQKRRFIELPYTLPQDFTLFILMQEKDLSIWKRKVEWIAKHGGMVLVNTHPDYMNFENKKCRTEEYPVCYYEEFLLFIKTAFKDRFWHAKSKVVAEYIHNS